MENSGAVTIEGENYEVVDECVEEEDTANATKPVENSDNGGAEPAELTLIDNGEELTELTSVDTEKEPAQVTPMECEKEPSKVTPMECEKEPTDLTPVGSETGPMEVTPVESEKEPTGLMPVDSETESMEVTPVDCEESNGNENQNEAELPEPPVELANDVPSENLVDESNVERNISNVENDCPQKGIADSIDFTADISLDQLDEQKDMTDEDVLNHLDEIENIVLESSDFQTTKRDDQPVETCIQSISKNDNSAQKSEANETANNEQKVLSSNVKEKPEMSEKNEWYEQKLAEKQAIIKERLSKVARVLGISYPCYEKWLEWEEKVRGNPLCRLRPARHCRLDKPYTNRWKFICNRKRVEESGKKLGDADGPTDKNTETVWKLEASGACGININNESEFPPFVLRAVKIFEDFLQTTEQPSSQGCANESFSDDISIDMESKKEVTSEAKQEWLWLLVRCNSMDELMLFATGKNISRSTMDRLKQVYESGPGKDCNVKSLYCKSMNKHDDTIVTNTTFLVGSEALDEVVGGLKIQLAPKTNFWSNTAGAENVANAVIDLLAPTSKTVVLEIGCGIGLIGLMMASKCQQVIGVDSPSEVEEAEMTCELNSIKNASFIMGSPSEVTGKIVAAVKNRKTSAIINANTNIGRALEIITCLRNILSIKRIVMITTLTKQSVRAILELARPGDHNHGIPFIPTMACVVDTLPVGPHFEAVILLQRRPISKLDPAWFLKNVDTKAKAPEAKNPQEIVVEQNSTGADKKLPPKGAELWTKKSFNKTMAKQPAKKAKVPLKKPIHTKAVENLILKNKFKGKRTHSPDKGEVPPKKIIKKLGKFGAKPWHIDQATKKKKEWVAENSQLRINPLYDKKLREPKEQADLREKLSNNRVDTDIAQTVKEHQVLLEIAKEKLSGPTPTVDVTTAKQLQNMLNMVLEQTNKLQSQLPRSVWDRIAPPENVNSEDRDIKQEELPLKGRYIQETSFQDIVITTPNKKFLDKEETKPFYKKYNNLPPLEPNTVMPAAYTVNHREKMFRPPPERYHEMEVRQQVPDNSWNREKIFERNRWNEMGNMRRPMSPIRRQASPIKHHMSPPKRLSPKRPLLSPPRRPCSPPRRHFSPLRRPTSPMYRQRSPLRRQMSPPRRPMSPPRRISPPRRMSPPRRPTSSPRRAEMLMNRPMSPLRRQMSPPRRQMSPMRRPVSPPKRQIPSPNRMMSPNRQEMLLSRRQTMLQERQQMSPPRRGGSPQRFLFGRPASPPKRQQSPQRRQMSPPQRFGDEWDIPTRRAVEQNTWARPVERMPEQNVWRNDKPSTSGNNWDQTSCNDRQRKVFNQEKWDNKDSGRNDTWSSGANNWNPKQQVSVKSMMSKETWSSGSDNRWPSASNMPGGSNNDNWNIRGKDSFPGRKEGWMDNKKQGRWETLNVKEGWKQSDKEDLNELPEDARDPWGDDGNLGLKERWLKFESTTTSSWNRDGDQGEKWSKPKDNWQNKGLTFSTKPQWQNNGIQNVGESRWLSQSNIDKKPVSSTWQGGKNMGSSWQSQNSNFQSQRPFSTTQFKGFN